MQPGSGDPQGPFGSQTPGGYAYGAPPVKKGGPWKMILIVVGVIGVLGVVVCCGGGYFMFNQATGMLATKLKNDLGSNAELQKHIGAIQSIDFDMMATGEHQQKNPQDQQVQVYKVKGDKGEGMITAKYSPDQQTLVWARLRTSSGEVVPLVGSP